MNKAKKRMYSDFAWIEHIIAPPEDYVKETDLFSRQIRENSKIETGTLLHLGAGAGGNDYTFKKHFKTTGVDISEGMLEIGRRLNPEVTYLYGDMRTMRLKERFDAVVIPDSIGHMTTKGDLRQAILTAYTHLKPGGVLLIVTLISEEFRENNFVYTGSQGDIEITVFENNHAPDPNGTTYESTIIFLIRRKGELEVHSDTFTIGLFTLSTWLGLLKETGLEVKQMKLEHSYDPYLVGEGEYTLKVFICSKPL